MINKKVIVGMSGGVDSTIVAALLKKEGYDVEGVFLEFWKDKKSREGFKSARAMADALGVSIVKVNAEEDFKKNVVNKFIDEYKDGRTPNPCIVCNPKMKFNVLLNEMKKRNADFLATGHYVRIKNGKLFKAKDKTKDQSYFLYGLKREQLEKVIFPLGRYLKSQVREIAKEMELEVANREESQDICFISQDKFDDFLKEHIKNNSGKIQSVSGKILGNHEGLHFYTIGQRKGINLGGDGPYYVVKKDIRSNVLVVSNSKNEKSLLVEKFEINNANWISENIKFPLKAEVKVRYHSNSVHATILEVESEKLKMKSEGKTYKVILAKRQKAITPGQSAVFYKKDEILGGGIIA